MTAFAMGLQEGVQDGRRSPRKALLRETVDTGSNELAYTDTRLFCSLALSSRLLRITCPWAAAYDRIGRFAQRCAAIASLQAAALW